MFLVGITFLIVGVILRILVKSNFIDIVRRDRPDTIIPAKQRLHYISLIAIAIGILILYTWGVSKYVTKRFVIASQESSAANSAHLQSKWGVESFSNILLEGIPNSMQTQLTIVSRDGESTFRTVLTQEELTQLLNRVEKRKQELSQ